MTRVRLMDTPADYERLGINPDVVERWEDQRRDDGRKGVWEWWYFDTMLDDGASVVVQFFTKSGASSFLNGDHPRVWIKVTEPDGTVYDEKVSPNPKDSHYGGGRCDVRIGKHTFRGDLQEYDIHVERTNGVGADLHLSSRSKPFRPGSSYFGFGDDDEDYFTWLCVVPKGEVTGTVTTGGVTREVHGTGYHDHQWGNSNFQLLFNHWTWARQAYDDYSILVFDFVTAKKYGYKCIPVCFIQDADGNLVFSNTHDVTYEVLAEMTDPMSGKPYPKKSRYTFDRDDVQVVYTLTEETIIESRDMLVLIPQTLEKKLGKAVGGALGKAAAAVIGSVLGRQGIRPSYTRFTGTGELEITQGTETVSRSGDLIYEFMYPAPTYRVEASTALRR
ncbi:MAG: lipocalin-like domain-containing protein [Propionicimonas sp.]|uniref:lipocalin-like domain-containing protein n=1 Tax=Propionicimonas sp. TaxID=1955623 RepID=UPI002B1F94BF|nr:lipocalin-like domain-containing protein [Propionicimonas sp.]MEA4944423.1 lipocalin-like domain-containing protein [Propionicimonas sp.]